MADEVNQIQDRIRDKLRADKVKLWLPPFSTETGLKGEHPAELVSRYSRDLGLSEDIISEALESLRQHAVNRLAADNQFSQTGVATLHVKFAGQLPPNLAHAGELSIETRLSVTGAQLKHQIITAVSHHGDIVNMSNMKLITSGRVVNDDVVLLQQPQIRHNCRVMALCLSATDADTSDQQQQQSVHVARARQAAEWMSSREDDGSGYFAQISDQTGRPVDLPREERKALMLAMVLHEKGRAALKRRQFSDALVFLLEADSEFNKCRSSGVLSLVDNYAIVCLDICWCYLCLQNISSLPDAERRLKICEECFHKSYGANLERLTVVKGGTGTEAALFVRLHLLQAVVAFHQRRNDVALSLLAKAESELNMLKTSEVDMQQVMMMGFSEREARLGLRACQGDIQRAVAHIVQRREDRRLLAEKDREKQRRQKLQRSLGKTRNNSEFVNVDLYENLISMGFNRHSAASALKLSNNDLNLALQMLHDNPAELQNASASSQLPVSEEVIAQVVSMGFDADTVRAALRHFNSDIEQVINELVQRAGNIPDDWYQGVPFTQQPSERSTTSASTSASHSSSSSDSVLSTSSTDEADRLLVEEEILPDIPRDDEDYLDLTLDDEASFLDEYKSRLASLQ